MAFQWPKLDNWPARIGWLVIFPVVTVMTILGIAVQCGQGYKLGLYPNKVPAVPAHVVSTDGGPAP